MATASFPLKQTEQCALSNDSNKDKLVIGRDVKDVVKAKVRAIISGKTKVKKKMRVEDIITNLKKVKQVENTPKHDMPNVETEEEESFASMCTIRQEPPPDFTELIDIPAKQSAKQTSVVPENETCLVQGIQTPTIIKTAASTSNPPNPVRQVILQTVPAQGQSQPLIINNLPPGFKLVPSGSIANLQNASKGQQKLLLITKGGGPFFLSQQVNASINQTQAKPNNSSVFSPTKLVTFNSNSLLTQDGPPKNLNKSPAKTDKDTPLITVQYNLPYPNNNCKVVNNPTRTVQNVQTARALQTRGNEVSRASRPREMVVNFAGSQTAHITTMPEDPPVLPQQQTRFNPTFVKNSSPETFPAKCIKMPSPVEEKKKKQVFHVVKFPPAGTATNVSVNAKSHTQMPQRRSIYDEKIAKLTGKSPEQTVTVNGKSKTLSNGLKKKANTSPDVRVSNRKRQQTEKAQLFEKAKKRKRSGSSLGKEKIKSDVKVEDSSHESSRKAVRPEETLTKSKKIENVSPQPLVENEEKEKVEKNADPDSLYRDPALLTREERALQRALMMFKELEEKQARKKSASDDDKTSSRKSARGSQESTSNDVQRKRRVSKEGNGDSFAKKRKRVIEEHLSERKSDMTATNEEKKEQRREQKNSEIVSKMIKEKMNLTIEKSPVESGKRKDKKVALKKAADITSASDVTVKESPSSTKDSKKAEKDVTNMSTKNVKPMPKTPDSVGESKHRVNVKTYMLVPSYHGFKDFSPIVLGSRTRSKKTVPVKTEKEDEIPATKQKTPEKDIPLLVIESVGNKAVKQDVVVKDDQMRDLVKNSLRKQGMLKQELELTEKNQDTDHFENREKRHLVVNRNTGETVLHKAARMGYDETVYHCIQQGSDSNAKDNAGWTPLHEACSRGHDDVVKVLVKYNADVNACSNDGIRPIHDAADNGNTDSLRFLMAYGADPFISTYAGRSVVDCAKRAQTKDYIKACIGDLYLNDERNSIVSVDYENRWDFRGSSSCLDNDRKYPGDIFDNIPKEQSNKCNSVEFEWSETPHLPTYSLPLYKDGAIVGRKNYILLNDLQESLNKPRQNVVRLLKRTKIREVSCTEFKKEVSNSYFNCECSQEEGNVELVPLNWTVRSLLKIKCEHLAL